MLVQLVLDGVEKENKTERSHWILALAVLELLAVLRGAVRHRVGVVQDVGHQVQPRGDCDAPGEDGIKLENARADCVLSPWLQI